MTDYETLAIAARRDRRRMLASFVTISLVLLAVLGVGWLDTANGRNIWRAQALETQQQYDDLLSEYTVLYDEYIESTGVEPDAQAPAQIAEQGPQGAPGAVGPVGPQGPQGAPGPVGPQGVEGKAGAVGATGDAGPQGEPGPAGANGADGNAGASGLAGADGPAGPVGPAGPEGPAGPQGTPGANGADGRGIQSLVCDDAGRWQVTYTDGTTADAGACRTDPTPDPTTPPDPLIDL